MDGTSDDSAAPEPGTAALGDTTADDTAADDTPASGPGRRRAFVAVGAVVVLALLGGLLFALTRDSEDPPEATTTTEARTTTTRAEPLPVGTFEIATAKSSVTTLKVSATVPEGWEQAETSVVPAAAPTVPPSSEGAFPPREPLPTVEEPIQGRFAVAGGWEFENPGPYEPPQAFTMLVTERRGAWVKVLLPLRPNHTEGYVATADVDISESTNRLEISLTDNMLRAYDGAELVAETPVVAGSPFTQTPTGRFYITDIVPQTNPGGAYGPFALATNGYSEMMDEFDTGVPVVALHGTNAPDKLGTDVSNGCVRLPNDVVTLLAETFPRGTPVFIWP